MNLFISRPKQNLVSKIISKKLLQINRFVNSKMIAAKTYVHNCTYVHNSGTRKRLSSRYGENVPLCFRRFESSLRTSPASPGRSHDLQQRSFLKHFASRFLALPLLWLSFLASYAVPSARTYETFSASKGGLNIRSVFLHLCDVYQRHSCPKVFLLSRMRTCIRSNIRM